MNRWLVLEAFADKDRKQDENVRMQVLNIHSSVSAAYWHWGQKGHEHRLFLIDLRKHKTYNWDMAFTFMCYEQLLRLESDRRIETRVQSILISLDYIAPDLSFTNKGRELLAQLHTPKPLQVTLGHIQSTSKMKLR